MKFNKKFVFISLIIFILISGFLIWSEFGSRNNSQKSGKSEISLPKIPIQAHKLFGFKIDSTKVANYWQSEIQEFQRLDENQSQFKIRFFNSRDKSELTLFQSINVLNPNSNLTGFDPNIRERVLVTSYKEVEKLNLNEQIEVGLVLTKQDLFFGDYTYSLVDLKDSQKLQNQDSLYTIETSLFSPKNLDQAKFTLKTVITFNLKEIDNNKIQEQREEIKRLILSLKSDDSINLVTTNSSLVKTQATLPFGEESQNILNQPYSDLHKAIDIVPSSEYHLKDETYNQTGLEIFYSLCDGLATGFEDSTKAKVIRLECKQDLNGDKIVYEYWHNQTNLVTKQTVLKGQLLGVMGNTGNSHGKHLHLVSFLNGERVDPYSLLLKSKS